MICAIKNHLYGHSTRDIPSHAGSLGNNGSDLGLLIQAFAGYYIFQILAGLGEKQGKKTGVGP